jgi:subtilisin family serine protease
MIARNVLALAPNASIWDAPLLPSDDEPDAPPGPSSASQLFHEIRNAVGSGEVRCWDLKQNEERTVPFGRPVIIVNAWGVMDPEGDEQLENGARGYRDNPNNFLVNDMARLDAKGIDVVFAAGNCGEPCPDGRCGQTDTGPGRSISGMNAHPCVLTVGAVRADGVPLALSAQGPGQLAAAYQAKNDPLFRESYYKPDLCAPSHFREADDAAEYNTGTSAACGFAAGILAALRSNPAGQNLPPAWLRSFLRATARPITGANWDPRLGFGIINGTAALAMIEK